MTNPTPEAFCQAVQVVDRLWDFVQWVARLDQPDPEPIEEAARRAITPDQVAEAAREVLDGLAPKLPPEGLLTESDFLNARIALLSTPLPATVPYGDDRSLPTPVATVPLPERVA